MKIFARLAILVALSALGDHPAYAFQAPKSKSAPHAAQSNVGAPGVSSRNAGRGLSRRPAARLDRALYQRKPRSAPGMRVIEQTAVLTKTGQLIVLVNVRVPSDTHAPIPAGAIAAGT